MKILFCDDYLSPRFINPTVFIKYGVCFALDGAMGVNQVKEYLKEYPSDVTILTNSPVCLDHRYGWNKEENHTDIYIWEENRQDFIRCDNLVRREIYEEYNIMQMYLNGVFNT